MKERGTTTYRKRHETIKPNPKCTRNVKQTLSENNKNDNDDLAWKRQQISSRQLKKKILKEQLLIWCVEWENQIGAKTTQFFQTQPNDKHNKNDKGNKKMCCIFWPDILKG